MNKPPKIYLYLLASLSFSLIFASAAHAQLSGKGDAWKTVMQEGEGKLYLPYYETPGIVYEDENGEVKGVCVDILKDFSSYIKQKYKKEVRLEFVRHERDFSKFLEHIRQAPSGVIGVGNVTITPERKRAMRFTPAYMSNLTLLLTHREVESLHALRNLEQKFNGFKAVIIEGSTHADYIQQIREKHYPSLRVQYVASGAEVINVLKQEPKAFTIIDFTEYFYAVKNNLPIKNHLTSFDLPKEELGMIMPLDSDWYPLWQEFLSEEYKNSVAYRKIINKNLGSAFVKLMDQ